MSSPFTTTIRDQLVLLDSSFERTQRDGQVEWNTVLSATERIRKEVSLFEGALVSVLRTFGKSWAEIGEEMGISRQAAWERFHGAVDEAQVREVEAFDEEGSS